MMFLDENGEMASRFLPSGSQHPPERDQTILQGREALHGPLLNAAPSRCHPRYLTPFLLCLALSLAFCYSWSLVHPSR